MTDGPRLYAVRLKADRDAVGLFYADDLDELRALIDECTEPPDCEITLLPIGGLYWPVKIGPWPPFKMGSGSDDPDAPWPWQGLAGAHGPAMVTESWLDPEQPLAWEQL